MIRINLLPVRETQKQIKGRQQLLLFLALVVLEAAVLFYFTQEKSKKYDVVAKKHKTLKKNKDIKPPKNIDDLPKKEERLKEQQRVLEQLSENQIGPVKMLNALSLMTTPISDPVDKITVKSMGWNPDWDAKRLWIDTFTEKERRVVITGYARSNSDVAEFYKRLNNDNHFVGFQLNISEVVELEQLKSVPMVRFNLEGLALYGPADEYRIFGPKTAPAAKGKGAKGSKKKSKKTSKKKG
ncbi:MAG: PilN domain-containing protein [Bradymonadia bacterium]